MYKKEGAASRARTHDGGRAGGGANYSAGRGIKRAHAPRGGWGCYSMYRSVQQNDEQERQSGREGTRRERDGGHEESERGRDSGKVSE